MIRGVVRKYFEGKTCIYCNKYGIYRLKDKRVKCEHCKIKYSIIKLRIDMQILYYFYLEVSARKAARELNFDYETVQSKRIVASTGLGYEGIRN